jgi:hypothetical protein
MTDSKKPTRPAGRAHRALAALAVLMLSLTAGAGCGGGDEVAPGNGQANPAAGSDWDQMNWDQGSWS